MRKIAIALACIVLSASAFAQSNRSGINSGANGRYEMQPSPYGNATSGSTEIEMRNRHNPDPASKYQGEIDSDGSVRMKNINGDRLRGNIDSDGYGKLRDQDGNTIRIRPR